MLRARQKASQASSPRSSSVSTAPKVVPGVGEAGVDFGGLAVAFDGEGQVAGFVQQVREVETDAGVGAAGEEGVG